MAVRDSQRSKVYKWENDQDWMTKTGGLSRGYAEYLAKSAARYPELLVKFPGNRTGSAWSSYTGKTISLPNWALTHGVVLHEAAHSVVSRKNTKTRVAVHGPEFVTEYCLMLHYLHPQRPTIQALTKSLNERNVQFSGMNNPELHKPYKRMRLMSEVEYDQDDTMVKDQGVESLNPSKPVSAIAEFKQKIVFAQGKEPRNTDNRIGRRVSEYNARWPQSNPVAISEILNTLDDVGLGDIKYDIDRGYLTIQSGWS
tara:strand:- start:19657 stop:20421 length:765 start_codon:yes stop_codon:yes gene_type:complete